MDREKVIKGWECHMEADTLGCADCPYRQGWRTCNFADTLFKDVYALLKEQEHKDRIFHALEDDWKQLKELLKKQEAVKLHTIDTDEEQYSFWFVCGNCGWKIYKVVDDENCEDRKQIHFCASCGSPINWGGR